MNTYENALYPIQSLNGYKSTILPVKSSNNLHDMHNRTLAEGNGDEIPVEIKEKIFQPFFTTKPTGSGRGLGLSLSYDIVTKGHGGS